MKKIFQKRTLYVGGLLLIVTTSIVLFLLKEPTDRFNHNKGAFIISGYDTVSYFTEGKPTKGSEDLQYSWNGGTWLFSSQEHLDLFMNAPDQYAPQYGGYCAWAISAKEKRISIDPKIWSLVDAKLYLNYSQDIGKLWNDDQTYHITHGDEVWQRILTDAAYP